MTSEHAYCPNCGIRYMNVGENFWHSLPGCGRCAQAGVRPRELYELRPLDEQLLQHDENA